MKNRTRFLLLASLLLNVWLLTLLGRWQPLARPASAPAPVNPVLGDQSYVARFGTAPTAATPEALRIQTHLAYVETYLRQHPPADLPADLQARRAEALDLLRTYWQAGEFPRNYAYPGQRRPCFIDPAGRLCAVGYLVAQTAGRAAAEQVNQRHQYDEVAAMHDDPTLRQWVAGSGLSLRECALIQPSYGYYPPATVGGNNIEPGYAVGSAVLGGVSLTALLLNRPGALPEGRDGRFLPALAVMSGTAQVVLGVVNFPAKTEVPTYIGPAPRVEQNETQKLLSVANIGLGTATLLLGTWNLLHRPATTAPAPRTSWQVGPAPAAPGQLTGGASVYFTRRL